MSRQLFAVAYLRTASREPENIEPLLRQLNACHHAAMQRHTAISDVFIDWGKSGNTAERPAVYELLGKLDDDPTIGYVIAAEPTRIARDLTAACWIEQRIAEAGCHLVYADGSPLQPLFERKHAS